MKTPKEIAVFLRDFLTPAEYETLIKRAAISYWLKKGRSNSNIKNNLKVSNTTIKTVASSMKKEGIKLSLKKIEAEEFADKWSKKIERFIK